MNTRQLKCESHPEENLNWVCLEMMCERRMMCSKCAVKIHDKTHRVEELESIKQKGLLSFFPNAPPAESAQGGKQKSQKKPTFDPLALERIFSVINDRIEKSLTLHEKEIESLTDEIEQPGERSSTYAKIAEIESDLTLSKNKSKLRENLSEAITNIHKYILRSGSPSIELRHELLQRKKNLLLSLQNKFLNILKGFFEATLVMPLCNLFESQVQVLKAKQEVKVDEGHFISFLETKWTNEYAAIEETLLEISDRLAIDINGLLNPGRAQVVHQPEVIYQGDPNAYVPSFQMNPLPPIGGFVYPYPAQQQQQQQTPTHPHIQYYQLPLGPTLAPIQQQQQQGLYHQPQGFPSGYKYTPLTPYNGPGPKAAAVYEGNVIAGEAPATTGKKAVDKIDSDEGSQQACGKISGKKGLPPLTKEPSGYSGNSQQRPQQKQGSQIEEEKVSIFESEKIDYITPKKCSYKEERYLSGEGSRGYLRQNTAPSGASQQI